MNTVQIHPGDVRAWCPGCKTWKRFDLHTNTFIGHGWLSIGAFVDCAGSEMKIRNSKRAVYRKADRKWLPVRWNEGGQEWEIIP